MAAMPAVVEIAPTHVRIDGHDLRLAGDIRVAMSPLRSGYAEVTLTIAASEVWVEDRRYC